MLGLGFGRGGRRPARGHHCEEAILVHERGAVCEGFRVLGLAAVRSHEKVRGAAAHRRRNLAAMALDVVLGIFALHAVEDAGDDNGDAIEAAGGTTGRLLVALVGGLGAVVAPFPRRRLHNVELELGLGLGVPGGLWQLLGGLFLRASLRGGSPLGRRLLGRGLLGATGRILGALDGRGRLLGHVVVTPGVGVVLVIVVGDFSLRRSGTRRWGLLGGGLR
mmetsp:Transcript_3707/g.9019  ORF Transcript_3707/g.9019 Transcript_3707/m.9019 type:complete len:220 (+) Transcript_3707:2245-2904(+)